MSLIHTYSGKVRDIYEVETDPNLLFMVASDRISAFDVVMAEPIPDKGRVLTAMTVYWLDALADLAPNHLVTADPAGYPEGWEEIVAGRGHRAASVVGRAMLVRRAQMLPIECIVRGYLSGSAWKEYAHDGTVHGRDLPAGLKESAKLPEPLFSPSTKATDGHDENISFERAAEIVGKDVADHARELCVEAYGRAAAQAAERGIIIADTKFELGFIDGALALCDEVLTPDSSRFWPAAEVVPGLSPPSFDKQPVRDWLESTGWDKSPPPPPLPSEVVDATSHRYRQAYEKITGLHLDGWFGGPR